MNLFTTAKNCMEKWIFLFKKVFFLLFVTIYSYIPPEILDSFIFRINSVVVLRSTKLVNCIPEFRLFYCVLEY